MKEITAFPRQVREIENVWIPLSDGARLAARLWLPADAEAAPVPALLEYLPYRKRDLMRVRDEPMHHYLAGHGYAAVRVDIRGSGDSDGVLTDEYSEQEIVDALEVIAWLAAQPWCTGDVGMMGISWGGFNSLQVAARRPPALKAIISLCAADDRYADDAHYMGGCLLNENLQWGSILMNYNAWPPDPEIVGDQWRDMWRRRLENATPFPALWMTHQRRDAYWRHGSVCEDFAAVRCPVFLVGGWADGYSNAIPRLLDGLTAPRKGLIGPWAHTFPHDGVPGPAIGFLQEALRWWDRWLKGVETGIMDGPDLRVWMQDCVPPEPFYEHRPGRWVAEARWPSPRIETRRWHLNAAAIGPDEGVETPLVLRSPQSTGLGSGEWCAFGADGEMPIDQRSDDGKSLTFDSAPLGETLEILGAPVVTLDLASDCPSAFLSVRLNAVAPDGAATRVTYGLLNLTHRDSAADPSPLEPGRRYRVAVRLNEIAQSFPPGHVLRVSVSTSYWPIAWPSPDAAHVTVFAGPSTLELPVRPPDPGDAALPDFLPPEQGPSREHRKLLHAPFRRRVERDLTTNEVIYTLESDGGDLGGAAKARIEAIDLDVAYRITKRFRISETDPLTARAEIRQSTEIERGDWKIGLTVETGLSVTRDDFLFKARLVATEGGETVIERDWDERIPRDFV